MFSHDREGSFEKIKEWKQLFNENNPRDDIPSYLIIPIFFKIIHYI